MASEAQCIPFWFVGNKSLLLWKYNETHEDVMWEKEEWIFNAVSTYNVHFYLSN